MKWRPIDHLVCMHILTQIHMRTCTHELGVFTSPFHISLYVLVCCCCYYWMPTVTLKVWGEQGWDAFTAVHYSVKMLPVHFLGTVNMAKQFAHYFYNSMKALFLFPRLWNRGSERLNHLSTVTKPVNSWAVYPPCLTL